MSVGALVAEAASQLRVSLPAGIELEIGEVPGEVAVSGEPAQLQQVLVNLCKNAAQAMDGVKAGQTGADNDDIESAR